MLPWEKFEQDDREPFAVLDLGPGLNEDGGSRLEFYGFNPLFWLQSFLLLTFQSIVNCLFAVIVYYGILCPQQQQQHDSKSTSSVRPLLLGYGAVIPALLILPLKLIDWMDLHNVALILCVGGSNPAMLVFRCLEAMHGTLPPYLVQSVVVGENREDEGSSHHAPGPLSQFVLYYASALQFELDPSTGAPVTFDLKKHGPSKLFKFLEVFVQTSLCYSLLLSFGFRVFPSRPHVGPKDMLYWGNIFNNYLMAAVTSLCLESGACGLGFLTSCLTGIATMEFSDSPLTKSTSPSDFWGQRWNRLTGPALRRGAYQPLRKRLGINTHAAAALTFIASGLLHEYVLFVLSHRHGLPSAPVVEARHDGCVPNYGNHLLFFSWCGITLLGERFLAPYLGWLPRQGAFRVALVLLTTLPFAHLFTDEYITCSFYTDISLGFPKVLFRPHRGGPP